MITKISENIAIKTRLKQLCFAKKGGENYER